MKICTQLGFVIFSIFEGSHVLYLYILMSIFVKNDQEERFGESLD